ncbi:hypothetical protein SAMN04489742_3700 [Arthrobacter crystallopoietes]|uniref:Uncharacterized protein n=1 Tax=Crystallibacter crystallopoietes TaxID=37928 RepID=A0A1H1FWY8_9MICC|nr:hypothetical protein AC20117_20875 [Arthrobacter crystallopoietes]SDR05410.1 hypothetical protein SAMN04489742_3700 [Arthrobacter crystallopoietes]
MLSVVMTPKPPTNSPRNRLDYPAPFRDTPKTTDIQNRQDRGRCQPVPDRIQEKPKVEPPELGKDTGLDSKLKQPTDKAVPPLIALESALDAQAWTSEHACL